MRNHNHLLGAVEGVDGIKTGYTRASGFNLITSVHRDGRHIIAVVLGGKSSSERDAHMRKLIAAYTKLATFQGSVPVRHELPASVEPRNNSADPIQALIVRTRTVTAETQQQPMSPVLSGATLIRASDFLPPSGQVAARWPLPSEVFAPVALGLKRKPLAITMPRIFRVAGNCTAQFEAYAIVERSPRFLPGYQLQMAASTRAVRFGANSTIDECRYDIQSLFSNGRLPTIMILPCARGAFVAIVRLPCVSLCPGCSAPIVIDAKYSMTLVQKRRIVWTKTRP